MLSLTSIKIKRDIIFNKKDLKSDIELSDDYPKEVREERKNLYPLVENLRNDKFNVHLRWNRIYVNGVECTIQECEKLISNKKSSNKSKEVSEADYSTEDFDSNINTEPQPQQSNEDDSTNKTLLEQNNKKRDREIDDTIENRPTKAQRETKTTIIGVDPKPSVSGRNPIKDALKKQFLANSVRQSGK